MTSRHVAPPLTPKRWAYIKSIGADRKPVYAHVACEAFMLPNPIDPMAPWTPFVAKGVSFKYGPGGKPKRIRAHVQKWMDAQRVAA